MEPATYGVSYDPSGRYIPLAERREQEGSGSEIRGSEGEGGQE